MKLILAAIVLALLWRSRRKPRLTADDWADIWSAIAKEDLATLREYDDGVLPPDPWTLSKVAALDLALERLRLARWALVETGYFTESEVGPDIAPRIIELWAAKRDDWPSAPYTWTLA